MSAAQKLRDAIRLRTGDTDTADYLLSDAEIDTIVALWPDAPDMQAADAAEAIAALFSRQIDFATDGQSFNLSQRASAYRDLARTLRYRSGGYSVAVTSSLSSAVADQTPFGE